MGVGFSNSCCSEDEYENKKFQISNNSNLQVVRTIVFPSIPGHIPLKSNLKEEAAKVKKTKNTKDIYIETFLTNAGRNAVNHSETDDIQILKPPSPPCAIPGKEKYMYKEEIQQQKQNLSICSCCSKGDDGIWNSNDDNEEINKKSPIKRSSTVDNDLNALVGSIYSDDSDDDSVITTNTNNSYGYDNHNDTWNYRNLQKNYYNYDYNESRNNNDKYDKNKIFSQPEKKSEINKKEISGVVLSQQSNIYEKYLMSSSDFLPLRTRIVNVKDHRPISRSQLAGVLESKQIDDDIKETNEKKIKISGYNNAYYKNNYFYSKKTLLPYKNRKRAQSFKQRLKTHQEQKLSQSPLLIEYPLDDDDNAIRHHFY